MHCRRVLSGAVTVTALVTAGCAGDGSDPVTDGGDPTDATDSATATETDEPSGLSAVTFVPRASCPDPGGATVDPDADPVSVVGCVVGKNGCARQRLTSVDRDASAVTVVVTAVDERGDDEACTEALVNLGYEIRIDDPDPPTSVTVVHDDVDGRRTVADVTR